MLLSALLSLLVGRIASGQIQDEIGQSLAGLASQMSDRLDRGMYSRFRDIQIAATLETFRNPDPDAYAEQRRVLDTMRSTFPSYAWIGLISPEGKVLVAVDGLLEGMDVSQRPLFINGSKGPWSGDVHDAVLLANLIPTPNGEPLRLIDVATPIYNDAGQLQGVLAAHLNWTWAESIRDSIVQTRDPSSRIEILIISAGGSVLLGPPGSEGQNISLKPLDQRSGFTVESWPDNQSYLTGWSASHGFMEYSGLGWTVATRQPTDIAFAPTRDLQAIILACGAALGLLFAIVGWYISGRIGRPLLSIANAAEMMRLKGTAVEIPVVNSADEIGVLSRSLRSLVHGLEDQKEALSRLNNTLEKRVEERTEALFAANLGLQAEVLERKRIEAELEQARDTALDASRAKSEFLATMSHEIRTPMNAIVGMADLLAETPLNGEQQQYVHIFRRAGDTLLNIINDILDLAKVESGRLTLEQRDFDLSDLLDKTIEILGIRAQDKGLELVAQVMPDVQTRLRGDPERLRQVLVNLIGNAIKFTERGEIVLRVERASAEIGNGHLLFSVADSGIGIPREWQEQIFDNFTQVDTTAERRPEGTGLGLAICRRLVELMQGRIWVESTSGKGSTFYFTAQFAEQENPAPSPTFPVDLRGLRCMVLDDSPATRSLLAQKLGDWGAKVVAVSTVFDAINELRRAQDDGRAYDMLLLDCFLTDEEGRSAATMIMEDRVTIPTTILMVHSRHHAGEIEQVKRLGMTGYLIKPITERELVQSLGTILGTVQPAAPQTAVVASTPARDPRKLRILMAEDSADNRLLIQAHIKKTPYQLDVAENGKQAVEKFLAERYDLVLMDMEMPGMNGYEATRAIRRWEEENGREPTPIVALTAYALKEDAEKSAAAGCNAHLTKPIKKMVLLNAIQEFTGSSYQAEPERRIIRLDGSTPTGPELERVPTTSGASWVADGTGAATNKTSQIVH